MKSSNSSSSVGAERKKNRDKSNNVDNNKKRSGPLVPPPHRQLPSRKRARKVTTEFHKLLKEEQQQQQQQQKATSIINTDDATTGRSDTTTERSDAVLQKVQEQIEKSRQDYQRASQVSTSFHSTSKWVLGVLAQNGWLYGRKIASNPKNHQKTEATTARPFDRKTKKKDKPKRRPTKLLEIGAINTELLDAATVTDDNVTTATATRKTYDDSEDEDDDSSIHAEHCGSNTTGSVDAMMVKKRLPPTPLVLRKQGGDGRLLQVRAIDIHSMDPRIEEADFLALPCNDGTVNEYDVIVCSMVLNCGMTPTQRGDFLRKMCHFLQPNGLLFLTLPRTCLQLSPYIDQSTFTQMLEAVGLSVSSTRESPKIAFFICTKQQSSTPPAVHERDDHASNHSNGKWTKLAKIRRGKKYRNDFAIVLAPSLPGDDS